MTSEIIESAFDNGIDTVDSGELNAAVERAIAQLDSGESRVAEPGADGWVVNQWLKKAVLLSFRLSNNEVIDGGHSRFFDKVPLKYGAYSREDFERDGVQHGFLKLPHSRDESAWGAVMIPITQISNGSGPTALLTGANHGDEYEGPIALFDLANTLRPAGL